MVTSGGVLFGAEKTKKMDESHPNPGLPISEPMTPQSLRSYGSLPRSDDVLQGHSEISKMAILSHVNMVAGIKQRR